MAKFVASPSDPTIFGADHTGLPNHDTVTMAFLNAMPCLSAVIEMLTSFSMFQQIPT